jgi:hypothetical protein
VDPVDASKVVRGIIAKECKNEKGKSKSSQRKQSLSSVNGNLSVESLHRDLLEH